MRSTSLTTRVLPKRTCRNDQQQQAGTERRQAGSCSGGGARSDDRPGHMMTLMRSCPASVATYCLACVPLHFAKMSIPPQSRTKVLRCRCEASTRKFLVPHLSPHSPPARVCWQSVGHAGWSPPGRGTGPSGGIPATQTPVIRYVTGAYGFKEDWMWISPGTLSALLNSTQLTLLNCTQPTPLYTWHTPVLRGQ
jgi:hypothetical protein